MSTPRITDRRATPAAGRKTAAATSLDATATAWLAALAFALVTFAAIVLIGPPLGRAFLGPDGEVFWPMTGAAPEPVEHGRYVVALLGPLLLALALVLLARRPWRVGGSRTAVERAVTGTQLALAALVVVCFAAQRGLISGADQPDLEHARYFTWLTLLLAAALPCGLLALLRRRPDVARLTQALRETRARRIAAVAVAVLFTAAWLLTAVNADRSIGHTSSAVSGHILWSMSETFAILDGRTPLVNFHAQYGQLWPYVAAAAMAAFDTSIGVYTTVMVTISGLSLLAIYAVFRRIVHSSLLALALYLPFVATGFFMKIGPLDDRYGPANLFSLWPIRYGGPYILAWLLVRHLERAVPRRTWILFLVAGLTVLNNPEFGVGALAATVAALLLVQPPRSWRAAAELLANAALGGAIAVAAVVGLTLAHSGSLPDFTLLTEFSKLYGIGGWGMLLMPKIGIFVVVYLTFVAALVAGTTRALRGEPQPALTAMLVWIGVFGLFACGYFAGRSHPQVLIDLFSPWVLALALLLVLVVRALAARAWRRPTAPELIVLFCFGLAVCSLPQTPTPWSQIARIDDATVRPLFKQEAALRFIGGDTTAGEKVVILTELSHRVAYDLHLTNLSPYASIESMPTARQFDLTVAIMRREHVRKLFLAGRFAFPEELAALQERGFVVERVAPEERGGQLAELLDRA